MSSVDGNDRTTGPCLHPNARRWGPDGWRDKAGRAWLVCPDCNQQWPEQHTLGTADWQVGLPEHGHGARPHPVFGGEPS